jgi:predicted oxidoreductase
MVMPFRDTLTLVMKCGSIIMSQTANPRVQNYLLSKKFKS